MPRKDRSVSAAVWPNQHTTGDGIVSALQVLHALRRSGQTLAQAVAGLSLYPQVLVNVRDYALWMEAFVAELRHYQRPHLRITSKVVLQQGGEVRVISDGTLLPGAALDLDVCLGAERGLLGFTPEIFPVAAKPALRAEFERYLAALTSGNETAHAA